MGQGIMATDRMRALSAVTLSACAIIAAACAGGSPGAEASPSARASPTRAAPPPGIAFEAPRDPSQAPRYVAGRWTANVPLFDVRLAVMPDPSFTCSVTVDPGRQAGAYSCDGLLPPATDVRLELSATSGEGAQGRATLSFRTMADRLSGVPWFTEFEDPNGEALACAAASVRIIQTFTTGRDIATAAEILARGRLSNKSADPGSTPRRSPPSSRPSSPRTITTTTASRRVRQPRGRRSTGSRGRRSR